MQMSVTKLRGSFFFQTAINLSSAQIAWQLDFVISETICRTFIVCELLFCLFHIILTVRLLRCLLDVMSKNLFRLCMLQWMLHNAENTGCSSSSACVLGSAGLVGWNITKHFSECEGWAASHSDYKLQSFFTRNLLVSFASSCDSCAVQARFLLEANGLLQGLLHPNRFLLRGI